MGDPLVRRPRSVEGIRLRHLQYGVDLSLPAVVAGGPEGIGTRGGAAVAALGTTASGDGADTAAVPTAWAAGKPATNLATFSARKARVPAVVSWAFPKIADCECNAAILSVISAWAESR